MSLAALTGAVVALAPAVAATAAPAADAASSTVPTVTIMSPEEYAAAYQTEFHEAAPSELEVSDGSDVVRTDSGTLVTTDNAVAASTGKAADASSAPLLDPTGGGHWYDILWSDTDKRGTVVPTRFGDSRIGYTHYARPHNLTTSAPFRVIRNTRHPIVDEGAHIEYQALVVKTDDLSIKKKIRIVTQAATRTDDGDYRSPDGKNIGTITAYCEGQTKCPDWVNQL